MKPKGTSVDPDILGSLPALRRAARKARAFSIQTGTPFYVMSRGRVVDLNAKLNRAGKRRKSAK